MKTAICYSGQIGAMFKAYHNQHSQVLLPNNCDIYCYTSDAVSQKDNYNLNLNPINKPIEYLKLPFRDMLLKREIVFFCEKHSSFE